ATEGADRSRLSVPARCHALRAGDRRLSNELPLLDRLARRLSGGGRRMVACALPPGPTLLANRLSIWWQCKHRRLLSTRNHRGRDGAIRARGLSRLGGARAYSPH